MTCSKTASFIIFIIPSSIVLLLLTKQISETILFHNYSSLAHTHILILFPNVFDTLQMMSSNFLLLAHSCNGILFLKKDSKSVVVVIAMPLTSSKNTTSTLRTERVMRCVLSDSKKNGVISSPLSLRKAKYPFCDVNSWMYAKAGSEYPIMPIKLSSSLGNLTLTTLFQAYETLQFISSIQCYGAVMEISLVACAS